MKFLESELIFTNLIDEQCCCFFLITGSKRINILNFINIVILISIKIEVTNKRDFFKFKRVIKSHQVALAGLPQWVECQHAK